MKSKIKKRAKVFAKYELLGREFTNDYERISATQPLERAYIAGAEETLNDMWHNADKEVPKKDGDYITLYKYEGRWRIEIAPWRNGEYQGVLIMPVNLGFAKITHWMPIPKLPDCVVDSPTT